MTFTKFAAITLAGMLAATTAHAAGAITWLTPTNDTGNPSDVINSGTLVESATAGSTVTLNGVTFDGLSGNSGGTLSFSGSPLTVSGIQVVTGVYSAPNFSNADYNNLLAVGAYEHSPFTAAIDLNGLTAGTKYKIQIFEGFWNNNWATNFTAGNTSGNVNLTGPDQGAGASTVPQNLIGSFTAASSTEVINLSSPTAYVVFDAAQVRAVPEPATWALTLMGVGMIGAGLRMARRKNDMALTAT
jgi:hypothetical protein